MISSPEFLKLRQKSTFTQLTFTRMEWSHGMATLDALQWLSPREYKGFRWRDFRSKREKDGVHQRAQLPAEGVRVFCSMCQVSATVSAWLGVYGFGELSYLSVNPTRTWMGKPVRFIEVKPIEFQCKNNKKAMFEVVYQNVWCWEAAETYRRQPKLPLIQEPITCKEWSSWQQGGHDRGGRASPRGEGANASQWHLAVAVSGADRTQWPELAFLQDPGINDQVLMRSVRKPIISPGVFNNILES